MVEEFADAFKEKIEDELMDKSDTARRLRLHNLRKKRSHRKPAREAAALSPRLDTIREEETINVEPEGHAETHNRTSKTYEESSFLNMVDATDTQLDSKKNQTSTNYHIRPDDIFKSPLGHSTTQQDGRQSMKAGVDFDRDLDALFESVSAKEEDQGSEIRGTTPISDKSEVVQPSSPRDLSLAYKRALNRRLLRKFKATLRVEENKKDEEWN